MMLDVLVIVQTLPSSNHINARYQGCQLGANANAEAARAPKQQTTRAPCFHTPYKSRMDRWMMGRKIVIGCEPYVQRNKSVRFGTKLPQLQCRPCGQKWTTIEKIQNRYLQPPLAALVTSVTLQIRCAPYPLDSTVQRGQTPPNGNLPGHGPRKTDSLFRGRNLEGWNPCNKWSWLRGPLDFRRNVLVLVWDKGETS